MNPEKPWPTIDALTRTTASRGKRLVERLTIYPEFASRPDPFLAAKMRAPVSALLGPDGRAVAGQHPEPIAWQDPDVRWKPRTIALTFAKDDDAGLRADADSVYGDTDLPATTRAWADRDIQPERLDRHIVDALARAEAHRPISDEQAWRCSRPRARRSMLSVASRTIFARRRSATT